MKIFSIILMAIIVLFFTWCMIPKSVPHPTNEKYFTAYYTGIGFSGLQPIVLFRWQEVVFISDNGEKCIFTFDKDGYNNFVSYYPNGKIQERGQCLVRLLNDFDPPYPDRHDVKNTKCFLPDGTLGTEVIDGNGIQTIWYPNKVKRWELVLEKYQRKKHTIWYDNGQLMITQNYTDGVVDGPFKSYYSNGNIKTVGSYKKGERSGLWQRYNEDGSLKSDEDYISDKELF